MLNANIERNGLAGIFEYVLSADQVKTYKPGPRAYQMGIDAFKLRCEEILFVAHAGWDAFGARSFGYPTFRVDRLQAPAEELGSAPDAMGTNLGDLVKYIAAR